MQRLLILLIILIQACSVGGDYSKEFSGGFFYRSKGDSMHDIPRNTGQGEFPADVIGYEYDDDFIIAMQRPSTYEEPLYSRQYKYKKGRNHTYYWLVVHRLNRIVGRMTIDEFDVQREIFKVPSHLDFR